MSDLFPEIPVALARQMSNYFYEVFFFFFTSYFNYSYKLKNVNHHMYPRTHVCVDLQVSCAYVEVGFTVRILQDVMG